MQEKTREEQLEEIIDRLIGPRDVPEQPSLLRRSLPRLDISKPNIHDSKKEFLREKDAVSAIIKHLDIVTLQVLNKEQDNKKDEMTGRLRAAVNRVATKEMYSKSLESSSDLALLNIAQTDFYYNSMLVILEMISVYKERLRELSDQEKQFWTVSNRPPNHYARTIALRLARLYAKDKHQRPTFGIARDGNHPSTDFGRALEEVYSVLGIKAAVRKPAEWAIGELTEEDINPPVNALAGGKYGGLTGLAGLSGYRPSTGKNALRG